jgi:hypothetical protein
MLRSLLNKRTWEFANKLIKVCDDKKLDPALTPAFAGTISAGVAVEFVQFTAVYDQLPSTFWQAMPLYPLDLICDGQLSP